MIRTTRRLLELDIDRSKVLRYAYELRRVASTDLFWRLGVFPLEEQMRHRDLCAKQTVCARSRRLRAFHKHQS